MARLSAREKVAAGYFARLLEDGFVLTDDQRAELAALLTAVVDDDGGAEAELARRRARDRSRKARAASPSMETTDSGASTDSAEIRGSADVPSPPDSPPPLPAPHPTPPLSPPALGTGTLGAGAPSERDRSGRTAAGGRPAAPLAEPEGFAAVWQRYPARAGGNPRRDAVAAWRARLRDGETAEAMAAGVERYRAWCEAEGQVGTRFVMQAARFFGPSKPYAEAWAPSADDGTGGSSRGGRGGRDWEAEACAALERRAAAEREKQDADQLWLAERRRQREAVEAAGVAAVGGAR